MEAQSNICRSGAFYVCGCVAFSLLARILRECLTIHSLSVLYYIFLSGDLLAHINSTLYTRIGLLWLSELR